MNTGSSKLVLASASPRRKELLSSIGLEFTVSPASIDESELENEGAEELALRLSLEKARCVAQKYPAAIVLGSDTVVAVEADDGRLQLLGKPNDEEDAGRMLRSLSGRSHQVVSAFALVSLAEQRESQNSVSTEVIFTELDDRLISSYIATKAPMDKAGAYGIQDFGQTIVRSINGSYSNVVGLPLAEVSEELRAWGVWAPEMLSSSCHAI